MRPESQASDRNPHGADIVIVGAGTAGCILASRLSADPACQVVLIEAGGSDGDALLANPRAWPALIGGAHDWGYVTAPQSALGGRVLPYPRGRVLGGSSSINAMGHQRGSPAVFDAWAAGGCAGWGFADLLPYFRLSEAFEGGASSFRGGAGPVAVIRPAPGQRSALAEAFIRAAMEQGHILNEDFNGATLEGAAWNQLAIRAGARDSASRAYLHPVLGRPNLTVLTETTVLGLEFEADRCIGVRIADENGAARLLAAGETLLCAGAIDSPRLLMLAGIGDARALARLGIEIRVDAPGVGANLQDHPLCGVVYQASRALPASQYNHGEAIIFARIGAGAEAADIQIMMVGAPFTTPETGPAPEGCYSLVPCLMSPLSRGSVTLTSADPFAPARIDPNYLAERADLDRYVAGVDLAIRIGESAALAPWRARRLMPAPGASRAALLAHVRAGVSPFYHPVGTCRMGSDPVSVVDPDLRVRGVSGLCVIDASVAPTIPNAMPNAAVMAIAERAAAMMIAATSSGAA